MKTLTEIERLIDMLREWNNDLAAAVYELGGKVADQTEDFIWEDYEHAAD